MISSLANGPLDREQCDEIEWDCTMRARGHSEHFLFLVHSQLQPYLVRIMSRKMEKLLTSDEISLVSLDEEIKRLQLLENAVLHYGGGLDLLLWRVSFHENVCLETSSILRDVSGYLRDIKSHVRQ